MKFIGRKKELAKLNEEYNRSGGFVVVYGRRRMGKTTLIKEFLKDKLAFYFLATEELENLYGRRTAQIRLMPLAFTEIYAVQDLLFNEAVEQYAVTGGMPKYLEFSWPKKIRICFCLMRIACYPIKIRLIIFDKQFLSS